MLETMLSALMGLLSNPHLVWLLALGTAIGVFLGAVPGLGGKLGIALLIPFVFGMDMVAGAVLLLSMHAVTGTSGQISSILFGVPQSGDDAATVLDGYPMAKKGEAGRALGASLVASGVGGVLGAVVFAALIPVLEPVVLAFSPAEFFLLAVLGITFIAFLSGRSFFKGISVGLFGMMLAFVGMDPQTGTSRYAGEFLFLWDGMSLITVVLAIFAVPEMIALGVQGGSISTVSKSAAKYRYRELFEGSLDIWRHRWLVLRTSVIGAVIGIIPGLGGSAAAWICYGHAVQSSKTPERFGKGAVEGVIAPETASNAKEGGALLPTLFFGIPGSSGMAVMLGAFLILGIQPGPTLITNNLPLVWTLIWTLVVANILAMLALLVATRWVALLTFIRGGLLIPFVLILCMFGAFLAEGRWENLVLLAVLSTLGYGFLRFDWPRAPFAIGVVLGGIAEQSLHKALALWGMGFFLRPLSLVLIALIALTAGWAVYRARRSYTVASHAA